MAYGDNYVFKSGNYFYIMQKLDALIEYHNLGGVDDPELIIDCNALSVDISKEILNIHKFIHHEYRLKSLELDSLVDHPIEYSRVVKNKNPTTLFGDLEAYRLPYAIMMVYSSWRLGKAIEACDGVIALHSANKKLLDFVKSRVGYVAPNLCGIVGNAVAVKLIATAGDLSSSAKMLTFDVVLLGTNPKRKFYRGGYIEQSEIIEYVNWWHSNVHSHLKWTRPENIRLENLENLIGKRSVKSYGDGKIAKLIVPRTGYNF